MNTGKEYEAFDIMKSEAKQWRRLRRHATIGVTSNLIAIAAILYAQRRMRRWLR